MAPQATATHRKKEAVLPAFASISASDIVRAPTGQRSIPLDLLPLLKPFKRSGRLALRIERLPQRAKLSAGRRNSDGSWSLASDELEELTYLIPSNIAAAHELTIRVMKFDDGAASTLKVIQYPIASLDAEPAPVSNDGAICRSTEADDPVLRSQLGEMQSLFAVRESELLELRAALQHARDEKAAELETARAAWELELKKRLAEVAARVQSDKKKDHDARDGDHHVIAQAEARAEQRFLARLEQASKQAEQRLVSERKAWQAESNTYVAAERQKWQAETEQRIEADRQKWLAETDKRVAAELARLTLQAEQRMEAERQKWLAHTDQRGELERLKAQMEQRIAAERRIWQAEAEQHALVELEQLKTQTQQHIESARQAWQIEADQRAGAELERLKAETRQQIESERQAWQAEASQRWAVEAERLNAEAQRRIESERQVWQAEAGQRASAEAERLKAEMQQRIESERQAWQAQADQRMAAERQRQQAEVEQRIQAARKTWQIETEQRADAERRRWEANSQAALTKAAEQWKAEESERSTAAHKDWQQQAARMLAQEADRSRKLEATLAAEADKSRKLETALEALVQAKSVSVPGDGSQELDRLRNELALTRANLAERDSQLAQRGAEMEQERERLKREAEASFEAAAKAWKAEESARLDAMAAKTRAQSQEALAEMAARCEKAERALAGSQASVSSPADDGYIQSLRTEISELRTALANQEVELGWARAALDEAQPLHLRRAGENLPITNFEAPPQEEPEPEANSGRKTLVRDCLLVVGLVIPLIVFYPWIAAYLPDNVQTSIASMTGGLLSTGSERPAVAHTTPPSAPPPVQRPTATVAKSVNVRATPAVKGEVVVTLQKNASVVVLEQQGNWTHVEVPAKDATGKPQQGWVYKTFLDAAKAGN